MLDVKGISVADIGLRLAGQSAWKFLALDAVRSLGLGRSDCTLPTLDPRSTKPTAQV